MKVQEKCLPCIVNQAIKVGDLVGLKNKKNLMNKVFAYLSHVDFDDVTTPELIGEIFKIIKLETGHEDPYKETRRKYNVMFLEKISSLEKEIERANNPFEEAVKYSIIGNIIDFNPIHDLSYEMIEEQFDNLKAESLEINDCESLLQDLKVSKILLYLGDNCGEICLDRILIKKMKEINPDCNIFFATRGDAVVNDSIEEDAYMIGMDRFATIISNGDYSLGTVMSRTSEKFNEIYEKADVVIAKGQANYESLSAAEKNIYFLLMTKCDVIAQDIGCADMKMIIKKKIQNNRKSGDAE